LLDQQPAKASKEEEQAVEELHLMTHGSAKGFNHGVNGLMMPPSTAKSKRSTVSRSKN